MLVVSNVFMTWAWYGHLKKGSPVDDKPLLLIILMSWGLAFFEYCFMIPANRIGNAGGLNVAQLKIMQEVITLCVFVPFALFYIGRNGSGTTSGLSCACWALFFRQQGAFAGVTDFSLRISCPKWSYPLYMKIKIITILAATAAVVPDAGCHHHDRDYYRPGPSHHYNHNNHDNGWHNNQNRPGPRPRPHYAAVQRTTYPYLYRTI